MRELRSSGILLSVSIRMFCMPAIVAGLLFASGLLLSTSAMAQGMQVTRSDITTVFGYYGVSHGISDRRFTTVWGNTLFSNNLGVHAEAHYMDREETAGFFAGGLSWVGDSAEVRGWLGTSSENDSILPELYGRVEGTFRTSAETGLVFHSALAYRSFRNSAEETAAEIEIAKYIPLETGNLILSALARVVHASPGDHLSSAFGAGLAYVHPRNVSVGVHVEGGRATYDGVPAPGQFDEQYVSIRPVVSFYLTDDIELVGLMEYSSRESYDVYGGHVGLKVHFDQP